MILNEKCVGDVLQWYKPELMRNYAEMILMQFHL